MEHLAEYFKVFSEPNRLAVMEALRAGRLNVTAVVEKTGLSQALVSKHLKLLTIAGVFAAQTPDELARLTDAMTAAGRSIDELELIGGIRGRFTGADDVADLDEALATIPAKVAEGYRSICFKPSMFTDALDEVPDVCRRVVAALHAAA